MPINSEKAQFNWLRTLLRKLGAISWSLRNRSAMCRCSKVDGHGSGRKQQIKKRPHCEKVMEIISLQSHQSEEQLE